MHLQILKLEQQIPGFNKEPFTFSGFLSFCNQENIRYHSWPFHHTVQGFYYRREFPIIGINEQLNSPERELIAFEELGHHFLGHEDSFSLATDTFFLPKIEYQAKVFAALCVLPTPLLEKEQDNVLQRFPERFREFRMRIYKSHLAKLKKFSFKYKLFPERVIPGFCIAEENYHKKERE